MWSRYGNVMNSDAACPLWITLLFLMLNVMFMLSKTVFSEPWKDHIMEIS